MISEFVPFSNWPTLLCICQDDNNVFLLTICLTKAEATKLFKYKKTNYKYWNRLKLFKNVVKKAILIAKAFCPGFFLLLIFDNAISYIRYEKKIQDKKKIS